MTSDYISRRTAYLDGAHELLKRIEKTLRRDRHPVLANKLAWVIYDSLGQPTPEDEMEITRKTGRRP